MRKFNVNVVRNLSSGEDVVLEKVFEGKNVLEVFKKVRKDEEVLNEVMWLSDEELAELEGLDLVDGKISDEDIENVLLNKLNESVWEGMLSDMDGVYIWEERRIKLKSKNWLNEDEVEGVLLLNGKTELEFYRWREDDEWMGLTVYFEDKVVGEEVEEIDGIGGWQIYDEVISVLDREL